MTGVSTAMTIAFIALALGSMAWGSLSDRFAALLGFICAGVMPLYSVLMRENFPLRMMDTLFGGTTMAGALGMATGPLTGGLIYDSFGSYMWLYVGSWVIGIGTFLIAMTFRPVARVEAAPAVA
jgi:MFS family permease